MITATTCTEAREIIKALNPARAYTFVDPPQSQPRTAIFLTSEGEQELDFVNDYCTMCILFDGKLTDYGNDFMTQPLLK